MYYSLDTFDSKRYIGLCGGKNTHPRGVTYNNQSIVADVDGNGITDRIDWQFSKSDIDGYGEKLFNYTIIFTINNKKFNFNNPSELPIMSENDLELFVLDLNSDGKFEIILYSKYLAIQSRVTIYTVENNEINTEIDYIINPGP